MFWNDTRVKKEINNVTMMDCFRSQMWDLRALFLHLVDYFNEIILMFDGCGRVEENRDWCWAFL